MKIAYALRRVVLYPNQGGGLNLPPKEIRGKFLGKAKELGFEGVELGTDVFDGVSEQASRDLRKELGDAGVPCVILRGGGGLAHPRISVGNRKRLEEAVRIASWVGAGIVNTTVGAPPRDPRGRGRTVGEPTSQGSSREASEEDFERTAKGLSEVAGMAADLGVEISIEVHQHSIVDNSWSALHLLELIDRPNVGVNPDLGNIYWTYDIPEESCEAAIVALAPYAKYWHCKNLYRVYIPEKERAIFVQAPLPDGEIDYRFAISAMLDAGYRGYLAIEGVRLGDQFHRDGRSVAYVKALLEELGG